MSRASAIAPPTRRSFAEVAVPGAWGSTFLTYEIPYQMLDTVQEGAAVWVSLRGKPVQGVVLRVHDSEPEFQTHPVIGLTDPPTVLSPVQIRTARWMARETVSGLMDVLALFLPPGTTQKTRAYLEVVDKELDTSSFTRPQQKLLNFLIERGETSVESARTAMGSSLATVIPTLEKAGALQVRYGIVTTQHSVRMNHWVRLLGTPDLAAFAQAPKQAELLKALQRRTRLTGDGLVPTADLLAQTGLQRQIVKALVEKGAIEEIARPRGSTSPQDHLDSIPELTPAQAAAWEAIEHSLQERAGETFLLYGVTGSGKTEIYLRAAAWCLRHGRSALILTPEIALSSQVAARFSARFGNRVAILHSALTPAERSATWRGVADGDYPIVVGPRSALFAPVQNLGLMVLDEEHDQAYKQGEPPRYHTRAVAEFLAGETGATLLLGSATPSTETYWRAEHGEITRLDLPERVGPALRKDDGSYAGSVLELPQVEIADMRLELHRGNTSLLSESLQEVVGATLRRGEQAILLLNRRGMATVVLCRSCGLTVMCPYCDIPLVYHHDRSQLVCHRCDYREAPTRQCRSCGGPLDYFGAGTQRVESEAQRIFPAARVLRWDQDIVRRQGGADGLLRQVEQGEVDIIVGTQMVAKGFDLPLVTAVGVVNADVGLHLPDFRSGERTFSLLTQVAGRAGRRGPGSRVVIQSYTPEHYAIQAAARHDYPEFYAEEIDFRRTHRYPPFVRLARFTYRHKNDAACAQAADTMARKLALHAQSREASMDLLGPAPAFASRVRGEYQWQVIMRSPEMDRLLDGLPHDPGWVVDIDPQSLL